LGRHRTTFINSACPIRSGGHCGMAVIATA
jgi:hypothetical protein